MYVCVCHGVTDKDIAESIDLGNTTHKQLRDKLCVGKTCGQCIPVIKEMLKEREDQKSDCISMLYYPVMT